MSASEFQSKIITTAEAVGVTRSADTIATSGFVGIGVAQEILITPEKRFVAPRRAARPDAGLRRPGRLWARGLSA